MSVLSEGGNLTGAGVPSLEGQRLGGRRGPSAYTKLHVRIGFPSLTNSVIGCAFRRYHAVAGLLVAGLLCMRPLPGTPKSRTPRLHVVKSRLEDDETIPRGFRVPRSVHGLLLPVPSLSPFVKALVW